MTVLTDSSMTRALALLSVISGLDLAQESEGFLTVLVAFWLTLVPGQRKTKFDWQSEQVSSRSSHPQLRVAVLASKNPN